MRAQGVAFSAAILLAMCICAHGQDLPPLFDAPCERYGVPKPLAMAIARKESSLYPWNLNIEGRTVRCATKEHALAVSRQALAMGLSFDVGVMQINSWWLRRYNLPLDVVLDPPGNIQVGVWILGREIQRFGLNWQAVASYHTPLNKNAERGKAYAASVVRILSGLSPASESAKPTNASAQTPASSPETPARSPILVKRFRTVAEKTDN